MIAAYSGGPSLPGVPAGARPEGGLFEEAVLAAWGLFAEGVEPIAEIYEIEPSRPGQPQAIGIESKRGPWRLYLRHHEKLVPYARGQKTSDIHPAWLQKRFLVSELLEEHLGPGPYSFAPKDNNDSSRYFGDNYPALFARKTTDFDFSGALVENDILKEKLLFEYKYCKSTNGVGVDGNAHERLAFQVLQYVEIALRFPVCSMNVIAAQAFSEFKNKYHPAFNQQSIRLSETFSKLHFRFAACRSDYMALFQCLANFLSEGTLPPVDYRSVLRSPPRDP
jgi:hypothetical protein